ncbi:MAG: hypothetical protein ACE5HL_02730 [Terriglobia bacterium]
MKGDVKYMSSKPAWAAELLIMFISGFVLASLLWLGLWYFQTKPAHAAALQTKENALLKCIAAKELCNQSRDKLQAENEDISAQLDKARVGWGRCIRSKQEPEVDEGKRVGAEPSE